MSLANKSFEICQFELKLKSGDLGWTQFLNFRLEKLLL